MGLLGPFYILYVEQLSGGVEYFGLAFAITVIFCSASSYLIGHLSDRFGRKLFLYLLTYTGAIILVLYTLIDSTIELFILQAAVGIITGASNTIETTILGDITTKDDRGKSVGKFDATIAIAAAGGLILSGFAVKLYGIDVLFYVAAIVMILSTIIIKKMK